MGEHWLPFLLSRGVEADVPVANFPTGVMERLGLGQAALRAAHPKLIFSSVSACGREGLFADRMGFDPVVQAESGFVSMNGCPDRQGSASPDTCPSGVFSASDHHFYINCGDDRVLHRPAVNALVSAERAKDMKQPPACVLGAAAAASSPTSMAGEMGNRDDEGQDKLRDEVAEPHGSRLRQAHAADGHQPAHARKQNPERQQVHQGSLLADRECGPEVDQAS